MVAYGTYALESTLSFYWQGDTGAQGADGERGSTGKDVSCWWSQVCYLGLGFFQLLKTSVEKNELFSSLQGAQGMQGQQGETGVKGHKVS